MNLKQAKALKRGDEVHYTFNHACSRKIGPRGGETLRVTRCRVNGEPHTWVRQPDRVQVPVKYGMYVHSYITEENLDDWHLASECPLRLEKRPVTDDVDVLEPLFEDHGEG